MTSPATTLNAAGPALPAPSPRRLRPWLVAAAQSAACLLLGALTWTFSFGNALLQYNDDPPPIVLAFHGIDLLLGLGAALVIGPSRFLPPGRAHTAVHVLLALVAALSVWALPAGMLALYRIGTRRRLGLSIAVALAMAVLAAAGLWLDAALRAPTPAVIVVVAVLVTALLAALPLLLGHVLATRALLMTALRERAASAEREAQALEGEREALVRERTADAARVRAEERTALARDMHDSISHHLATIAMHAGAMAYRDDLPPEQVRRAAQTVRDAAQQANRELRTVLTTLRTTDADAPLATVPSLAALVQRCREEGQDVTLTWEGTNADELAGRPRTTVVALVRILAEVAANAAKHAPGLPLEVRIAREGERTSEGHDSEDRVVLRARSPLPSEPVIAPTSTGHGLQGLQERARLLGGNARWGRRVPAGERTTEDRTTEDRTTEGFFEVEAWMPW